MLVNAGQLVLSFYSRPNCRSGRNLCTYDG